MKIGTTLLNLLRPSLNYKKRIKAKVNTYAVPPGKILCFITGKLRQDKPEEHVRQRMARSLVQEYGYSKSDLDIEFPIKMGRNKKFADIVVFRAGSKHTVENVLVIVEAKPERVKPSDPDAGLDQLTSYMAAVPNATHGLWVASEVIARVRLVEEGHIRFEDCGDIPLASGADTSPHSFESLVPASDALKDVFKRCHAYVATNQGGSKESAFHEFLKITFCKVFDERNSTTPRFFIRNDRWKSETEQTALFSRLTDIFKEVCEEYGYIFGHDDSIKLNKSVCSYLVKELQKYTLLDTDFDYKGSAYEEIVGANSRGDRGEFFTPRNLCAFAVGCLKVLVGHDKYKKLKIVDPACGTGGFLRAYIHDVYQEVLTEESSKWPDPEKC